ncbi:hypothetical protein GGR52DRAFT_426029 [Hypoxylon sp. FL1284]|nr:hypothetical protein GGR52DRAFT_426029 [Hypoxylon sp. FL1284]
MSRNYPQVITSRYHQAPSASTGVTQSGISPSNTDRRGGHGWGRGTQPRQGNRGSFHGGRGRGRGRGRGQGYNNRNDRRNHPVEDRTGRLIDINDEEPNNIDNLIQPITANGVDLYKINNNKQLIALDDEELYGIPEIHEYFLGGHKACPDHPTTLNGFDTIAGELFFLLLSVDEDPRWATDNVVFAKSDLRLIPEFEEKKSKHGKWATEVDQPAYTQSSEGPSDGSAKHEAKPTPAATTPSYAGRITSTDMRNLSDEEFRYLEQPRTQLLAQRQSLTPSYPSIAPIDYTRFAHGRPIAALVERQWKNGERLADRRFAFAGWFHVKRVNVFAPRSAELVRMHTQKQVLGGRVDLQREHAWDALLRDEWAVIKFQTMGSMSLPPPSSAS